MSALCSSSRRALLAAATRHPARCRQLHSHSPRLAATAGTGSHSEHQHDEHAHEEHVTHLHTYTLTRTLSHSQHANVDGLLSSLIEPASLCLAAFCWCVSAQSHKLMNPPYGKAAPLTILAFCTFGAASVIAGCIMYQQKKGGFWFKKKQSDK